MSLGLWEKKERLEIDCPMPANTHGFLKVVFLQFFFFFLFLIVGACFQVRKGIDCIIYLNTWMAHNVISHARLSLFFQFSYLTFYCVRAHVKHDQNFVFKVQYSQCIKHD